MSLFLSLAYSIYISLFFTYFLACLLVSFSVYFPRGVYCPFLNLLSLYIEVLFYSASTHQLPSTTLLLLLVQLLFPLLLSLPFIITHLPSLLCISAFLPAQISRQSVTSSRSTLVACLCQTMLILKCSSWARTTYLVRMYIHTDTPSHFRDKTQQCLFLVLFFISIFLRPSCF